MDSKEKERRNYEVCFDINLILKRQKIRFFKRVKNRTFKYV